MKSLYAYVAVLFAYTADATFAALPESVHDPAFLRIEKLASLHGAEINEQECALRMLRTGFCMALMRPGSQRKPTATFFRKAIRRNLAALEISSGGLEGGNHVLAWFVRLPCLLALRCAACLSRAGVYASTMSRPAREMVLTLSNLTRRRDQLSLRQETPTSCFRPACRIR